MKDRYLVAVTGGIGSGKSQVCRIIESKGYPVVYADEIARMVTAKKEVSKSIAIEFGVELDAEGNFDRKQLANIVFNNGEKLKRLNALTHPLIIADMFSRMEKYGGLVFAEVPLLFESNTQNSFDHVLIIKRDLQKRVQSVMLRDGLSESQVTARIKNQADYVNFPNIEHTVIYNDSDLQSLNNSLENFINEIQSKIF